ncbi:uncharacterized protein [Garra rufa]|uniref:uncharacterized protein n=1 Tax=Garra rufa TaxID=137080 RepID=UPI003CCEE0E7
MIHITIKRKGQEPRPRRCHADATLFTCPFCTTDACKPRQYHQIMTHIAGHKLRAVEYGDHVIYSCNIGCDKKAKHFHCCKCPKTYINKGAMKKHLCSAHPITTCTFQSQPGSNPLQEPHSQQKTASHASPEPPSHQKPAYHASPEPPSQQQPASHPSQEPLSQQKPASQPSSEPSSQQKPASHPLPEPPSPQQPTSHPPQEPLSQQKTASHSSSEPLSQQKTASHPSTEPPSQQKPASHELDLQQAAPPANERTQISVQCPNRHITIKLKGQEPRPRRCHIDATLFTCPFCTTDVCKPRQYHQIMTHIAGHKLRAVEYGDHVIYSCNISCGKKARHFHCCKCPKTYFNKGAIKKHLGSAHPITNSTPEPQPVSPPEPPSQQQPAPHPPPEPPSNKQPASHSKELNLQQAAPHPQELTASPAIEKKHVSVQCPQRHITVKQKGQEPRPQHYHADATLFTCPFCTADACKPRQYHQIMTHLAGHKLRSVEYGDFVMYSCNIGCGTKKSRHFHCFKCPKTYTSKSDLKRHLCSAHPISPETQPRPLEIAAHPIIATRKQISVQCPHCGLSLNSKNLKKHIERKHLEASHPTPSVLPAQCVDKKNGLYVVSESFCEPYTLIHVVKRFWGSSHKVMCELDKCNSQVEMAQSSEVFATQCVHLRSADYTYAIAPSEDLSEHVLTEMVEQKWIGDVRKKQCLKLQNLAKSKGATFTSLVTIGGPDYMYYISIYEPKVSQYSKLGRVLVNYNAKTNTWNCPCSKGRQSCLHNSIAKWCLYQMKKQLFENLPEAEADIEPAT